MISLNFRKRLSKMKLNAEQVSELREKRRRLKEKLEFSDNYIATTTIIGHDNYNGDISSERTIIESSYKKYYDLKRRLEEIENKLLNSEYLMKKKNQGIVDIGSSFTIKFQDSDESETYTLTEELVGQSITEGYISIKSELAKNIIGKREGEEFSYKVQNSDDIMKGKIISIQEESIDKAHFIREKPKKNRISHKMKKECHKILQSKDTEKIKQMNACTRSQIELLQQEKTRLINIANTLKNSNNKRLKRRLNAIRKILSESMIVNPPTDNTIGVGSQFSIMLFTKEKIRLKRVEMINYATSTETDKEYIEKISTLGSILYGLKENEEFLMKNVSGIVYDINNQSNRFTTTSPTTYQKRKR